MELKYNHIITEDKDKNIYVGKIVVNDKEALREACYQMSNDNGNFNNYHIVCSKDTLGGLTSLISEEPVRIGDKLVYRDIVEKYPDGSCEYVRNEVECLRLNSILSFIGLSEQFNFSRFGNYARDFIEKGLIEYAPFEERWNIYFKNMVNKILAELKIQNEDKDLSERLKKARLHLKMLDLTTFRVALESGIISYQAEPVGDMTRPLFGAFTAQDLRQIEINNAVLLNDDRLFEKVKVRK